MPLSARLPSSSLRWLCRLGAAWLLCLFALHAAADAPATGDDIDAALDQIRRQIDSEQQQVRSNDNLGDAELQQLRSTALAAQAQAAGIADKLAPELAGVQARVAELGAPTPGTKEDPDIASQRTLLAKSGNALDAQGKLARLLAVEGGQLAAQLWTLRRLSRVRCATAVRRASARARPSAPSPARPRSSPRSSSPGSR